MDSLVQLGIAIGTIGAVIVALFGDYLRLKFAPPKLTIRLLDPVGFLTMVDLSWTSPDGQKIDRKPCRFWHLVVENNRRWSTANQVQIVLTRIEQPGVNGNTQITWQGESPLRWRHQESYPLVRTLGPRVEADLCNIIKGNPLKIEPQIRHGEFPGKYDFISNLVVYVQARSIEVDSKETKFQISWDGVWEDGETEMSRHMKVEEL